MTKHPVALAIALVFATSAALSGCNNTANLTEQEHIQRAKDFEDKGQLKGSIVELKNAIQKNPDSPQARLLLGQVYLKSGMGAEAEKEFTRAENLGVSKETITPQLGEALLLMGEYKRVLDEIQPGEQTAKANLARILQLRADALLKLGQLKDACNLYQQALDANKNNPSTYRGLAQCAVAESNIPKAKEWLDVALKIDPKFIDALYFRAALLESDNKPDDAAKVYQQILANNPEQFRAHLAISGLHLKKGDLDAADNAIQAAEKVAAKAPLVMHARGTLELQRGNLDKASGTLQEVLRVAPNHLPSMLAYAMASYGLGNYQQSITYAGKVLGAAPNNLLAAKILAGSQLKTGDIKGATGVLESALAKHPTDAKLLALAGDAYLRAGDHNKAMGYLDKAAALEPENAAIKTRQAARHLATGDNKGALADLEAASSLSDKPGEADLALVMLHLKAQEYDKALQAIASLEKKLPNNPVTHNLRAAALLGKQDRAGARKELEQALAIEPKFFQAAANLARLDMADKKPEAARKRLESILALDKGNAKAMLAMAGLAAAEKKDKEYVDWLEKAAKADPKAIEAPSGLVQYYLFNKENPKALALARDAANANPDSLQALNLLGTTQMAIGDHANAVSTFNRLTLKAPQSPDAYLRLALAQHADKQTAAARASLKKALQLKPDFLKAQDALMRLELADKNPEAALQIARQVQTQQPKSPQGFGREGDILLSQKRYPPAIKAYEQALAKGAGTAGFIKLHRTLYIAGDSKAADQQLANWIKQNPKDLAARSYAADVYMQTNRSREAIAQFEELLKANPNNAIALNNLANLYQREKDSRALSIAEKAYKLAPDHPSVQDTLGWILVEQGQLPRALTLLGKAAAKLPKIGTIRYHHGVALARSGKKVEAKRELEAAIASGQKFSDLENAKALLKSL